MALNLETDLGSGTGLLYITTTSGAAGSSTGIITNLTNDTQGLLTLMNHAAINDKLVDTDSQSDLPNAYRFKYFVYNNAGAVEGTVHASATEITRFVTNYRTIGRNTTNIEVASGNILKYERTGAITTILCPTITSPVYYLRDILSADNKDDIAQEGDIVILRMAYDNTGEIVVDSANNYYSTYAGFDSIFLRDSSSFTLNGLTDCIAFQKHYKGYREIFRNDATESKVEELRNSDIPLAEKGVKSITATTGGTLSDLVSGSDAGVVNITGTKTLASSFNLPISTAALPGDRFDIWYRADITSNTAGGNKVTIGGVDLTDAEALNGSTKPILIQANYLGADGWKVAKILNSDESERDLGNPTASGQVLTSTTDGVRSWVDAASNIQIASAQYDFAVHAGAVSTITIGTELIPAGAIIINDKAIIEMATATTSSGSATISIGTSGGASDVDSIHAQTAFGATPFNSATVVTRTAPGGSVTVSKVSASAKTNITVTIGTAALTAGKFTVHVPYIA